MCARETRPLDLLVIQVLALAPRLEDAWEVVVVVTALIIADRLTRP